METKFQANRKFAWKMIIGGVLIFYLLYMPTTISLTNSEAIVLLEFLSTLDHIDLKYNHPSEEIVLNNLLVYLESHVSDSVHKDYKKKLNKARLSIAS